MTHLIAATGTTWWLGNGDDGRVPVGLQEPDLLSDLRWAECDAKPRLIPITRATNCSRLLSDQIAVAFNEACAQGELEVARCLIRILELKLARRPPDPIGARRRRAMETVVAAYQCLWSLRHPGDNKNDA